VASLRQCQGLQPPEVDLVPMSAYSVGGVLHREVEVDYLFTVDVVIDDVEEGSNLLQDVLVSFEGLHAILVLEDQVELWGAHPLPQEGLQAVLGDLGHCG